MNILILTNEYPPHIYGGAGVHVEYLSRELAALEGGRHSVRVLAFGDQREERANLSVAGMATDFSPPFQDPRHRGLVQALLKNVLMAGSASGADIVHCHTWYTHFGGCLLKQLLDAPLVLTTHSLEPHRPWKAEQLGSAYRVSTWIEQTAFQNADGVIAVSEPMRRSVQDLYGLAGTRLRVIPNGIDPTVYQPSRDPAVPAALGIRPDRPVVLFVGRVTRQKGILHLLRTAAHLDPGSQLVCCAGAADTPEFEREVEEELHRARAASRAEIVWIPRFLPREQLVSLYSQASVFVCPSVYEPFGIILLEAMACQTPVVATAVGGIPEVVVQGETGLLVPFEARGPVDFEPCDPDRLALALADAVNGLLHAPERRETMGRNARQRVLEHFTWSRVAEQTVSFYRELRGEAG